MTCPCTGPVIRACIVRFPDTGPEILDDAGHTPIGLFGVVDIDPAGWLRIQTEDVRPIGSTIVEEDETLTARGIEGGPRTGATQTTILFTKDGAPLDLNDPVHWSYIKGSLANVYITWISSQPE